MKPEVADGSFLEQHLITKPKPSETHRLKRNLDDLIAQNSTTESALSNSNNSIVLLTTTEKSIFVKQTSS